MPGFDKLINLERLEDFLGYLEEEIGSSFSLTTSGYSVTLVDQLGSNSTVSLPIYYGTRDSFAVNPENRSEAGALYIYSDYRQNQNGSNIPAIKIGDGTTYIVDLPFADADYLQHINNSMIHVSASDRLKWDDKVTCYVSPDNGEELVFTKDYIGD